MLRLIPRLKVNLNNKLTQVNKVSIVNPMPYDIEQGQFTNKNMGFLQILQFIVSLTPTAITVTKDLVTGIQNLEKAINGSPGTTEHSQAVAALAAQGQNALPVSNPSGS